MFPSCDPSGNGTVALSGIRCVPLLILQDGSPFGEMVSFGIRALAKPPLSAAVEFGSMSSSDPQPVPVDQKRPEGLEILDSFPRWVAMVADVSDPRTIDQRIQEISKTLARSEKWLPLVFLKLASAGSIPPLVQDLAAGENANVFIFSEIAGGYSRTEAQIGRGISLYVFTAWRAYCQKLEGNEAAALGLPTHPEGIKLFTAGFGFGGFDVEYHKKRFRHQIAEAVRKDWLRAAAAGEQPGFPAMREIIEFHLPDNAFAIRDGETTPRSNEIILGADVFSLSYSNRVPALPKRKLRRARDWLARLVAAGNRFVSILQIAALPQIQKVIQLRANRFPNWIGKILEEWIGQTGIGSAFFDRIKGRLDSAQTWTETLASAEIQSPDHRPPGQLLAKARKGVDGFPNLLGGLIRWGLLTVALLWIGYGSRMLGFWGLGEEGGGLPPDPRFTVSLDSLSGILLIAILALWLWCALRIFQMVHLAEKYALTRFLLAVCGKVRDSIRESGARNLNEVKTMVGHVEILQAEWTAIPSGFPQAPHPSENSAPQFSDSMMDLQLAGELQKAISRFHEEFPKALCSGETLIPKLDLAAWLDAVLRISDALAERLLFHLSFEQVAEIAQLPPQHRQKEFQQAVQEARKPAFGEVYPRGFREFTGLGPAWAENRGNADRVELFAIPLPMLAVFSIYPAKSPPDASPGPRSSS